MRKQACHLYDQIMSQSRKPQLFQGMEDTMDTRFDMLLVHLILVLRALRGTRAQPLADALTSVFLDDMDQVLRRSGVGDLAVAKRMRHIVAALAGRQKAYEVALAPAAPHNLLTEALARNFGIREADTRGLADYIRQAAASLEKTDVSQAGTAGAPALALMLVFCPQSAINSSA